MPKKPRTRRQLRAYLKRQQIIEAMAQAADARKDETAALAHSVLDTKPSKSPLPR